MDRVEQKIEEIIEEIGIEAESGIQSLDEIDKIDDQEIDFRKKEINKTLLARDSETIEDVSETIVTDNQQIKINVSTRPKCPNCGYVPTQEDDNPRLKSRCSQCQSRTCSGCHTECGKCDRVLCKYCSQGFAGEEEHLTLCPEHADQARQIDEFEKQVDVWETQLEKQVQLIQQELEFKDVEFDRKLQQQKMKQEIKIEELQQQTDLAKVANEQERLQIEEKKAELEDDRVRQKQQLEQEIKRRKQRLEEFEAQVDAELRSREQSLEELESEREHGLKVREHELEEKKQELEALEQLMEISKTEQVQARKDWELVMETQERMQDLKWDELNEFIDIQERLTGKENSRLKAGATDEEDDDDDTIYVEPRQLEDVDE